MSATFNPYEVLGIEEDAGKAEIKKAYRNLAKLNHPDKGGCEDVFKVIVEAYEVLIDDEKRAWFDEHGSLSEYACKDEQAERNLKNLMGRIISEHGFMADFTDLIVRIREEIAEITIEIHKEIEDVGIELLKLRAISKRLKGTKLLKKHIKEVITATEERLKQIKEKLPIQTIMEEMLEKASYDNDQDGNAEQFKGFELAFDKQGDRFWEK